PIKPIEGFPADTLIHPVVKMKKFTGDSIYFISRNLKINPRVLSYAILLRQNEYYKQLKTDQTIARLTDLKVFKFVNITFSDITKDTIVNACNKPLLDARIQLNRSPVHVFTLQSEGTNSSGNFGIAANIIYQNRNLFRGAEIFSLKLNGSMEIQQLFTSTTNVKNNYLFNTFETGVETGLEIPRFLLPGQMEHYSNNFRPTTNIQLGMNYQFRADYNRTIARVSFGYDWKESRFKRHLLYPIEINSVKINPDSAFMAYIQNLSDNRVKYQYTNHLIAAIKYSFLYNNQEFNKVKNFSWFTFNYESSGNLLRLANITLKSTKNESNQYELFNIPYAQYLRFELDFRRYFVFNRQNSVVVRANAGIGFAYGNSPALPFEKGFYAGGSNDIRGWRNRSLGPGSYSSSSEIERIGDNKLEFNIESRFPLYKMIKGAVFLDAGNIWLNKKNPDFVGGDFQLDKFIDEIAFSTGVGLRLDFDFFIIRGDFSIPIKNPALSTNRRWTINFLSIKDLILNFGIGYPF
ncbi:MAG: BamA/TamA family outer membrane protein, partial [Bacteroidota bacterium]